MSHSYNYSHIALEGLIGAGKSSVLDEIKPALDEHVKIYHEKVENGYSLPLFYQDPKRFAFLLQAEIQNSFKKIPQEGRFMTERSPKASTEVFSRMQFDKGNLFLIFICKRS